jgi:hypothetical protein
MPHPFVFPEDPLLTASLLRRLADDLEGLTMFQPSAEIIDVAPVLSNWRVGSRAAPCLIGDVEGHPVLGSCEAITSELFAIDRSKGWARTATRYYRLSPWPPTCRRHGNDH